MFVNEQEKMFRFMNILLILINTELIVMLIYTNTASFSWIRMHAYMKSSKSIK